MVLAFSRVDALKFCVAGWLRLGWWRLRLFFLFSFVFFVAAHPGRRASLQRLSSFYGRFYKLALTDCETVFEVNLFVGEGVWRAV